MLIVGIPQRAGNHRKDTSGRKNFTLSAKISSTKAEYLLLEYNSEYTDEYSGVKLFGCEVHNYDWSERRIRDKTFTGSIYAVES